MPNGYPPGRRARWYRTALTVLVGFAAAGATWAGPPEAPLADAAMRQETALVRRLLQQGADVNAAQPDGMTALHWAASHDDDGLIETLIAAGARLEATTRNGSYTALHLAARHGAAKAAAALLAHGAAPNPRTTTGGATPLHFAAGHGNRDLVAALLAKGAAVDAGDSAFSQTPLMWAAAADRREAAELLIANGANLKATSRVEDAVGREKADRAAAQARAKKMAAIRAAAARPDSSRKPAPDSARVRADSAKKTPVDSAKADSVAKAAVAKRLADSIKAANAPKPLSYGQLVGKVGGLTPLLFAAREGHAELALALLEAGADPNQVSGSDQTSPLLMATLNGHFDLARALLDKGADPKLASEAGTTPLYAVLNVQWSAKSLYPQPTAHTRQKIDYLELMKALLDKGADPNARLTKHLWYASYNFDLLGVNTTGATPFWRAAYGTDVAAMKLLLAAGADPTIPTTRAAGRDFEDDDDEKDGDKDPSGLPPVPVGGPGVYPIHAAAGVGYGEGFAANAHRHVPDGWMPAIKYLVEVVKADVNSRDHNGYSALHHAAARGDDQMIEYLVAKGADVTAVSRRGQTTADMANGPVQRVPPFLKTVALLEKLGSKNSNKCKSC
ncbi:MAG: hypothetical protein FJ206_16330 [Gemmatimonadetes bacterium]|nr:hypothetical protein [Gemmatimonadota bacterium]